MPVYAEQAYNAKMAIRFGYATAVNKFTINGVGLIGAIDEVLLKSFLTYFLYPKIKFKENEFSLKKIMISKMLNK